MSRGNENIQNTQLFRCAVTKRREDVAGNLEPQVKNNAGFWWLGIIPEMRHIVCSVSV